MSSPLVSVVIPSFNNGAFVADAIRSVKAQTFRDLECIVVDDGSTDDTEEEVAAFGDYVSILKQENSGVSRARNVGMDLARGRYISFLDADDMWLPRKIERQVSALERDPDLGAVYTGLHLVGTDRGFRGREDPPPGAVALRNTLLLERPIMSIVTGVIRRDVYENIGGFDESLSTSADCDFGCRIAMHYRVEAVHRPLYLYRRHPDQMHSHPVATERDMRIIFDRFFADPSLSPDIRKLRNRAFANLYVSLAGSYLRQKDLSRFMSFAIRAFARRPDRVVDALRRLASPRGGVSRSH